jgi:PTS system nitrogen regulatory IIA component
MKMSLDLHSESIVAELAAGTKDGVLAELAALVAASCPELNEVEILRILLERERLGSTGIGDGIAIPHGKLRRAHDMVLAFGRSKKGVDFNSLDGRKVHLFFLLLAPDDAAGLHLKTLARISRILKDPAVRKDLLDAPDAATLLHLIREQDNRY